MDDFISASDAAICGNGIVEKDEQCDCGDETVIIDLLTFNLRSPLQMCQKAGDICCYPAGTKDKECKLKVIISSETCKYLFCSGRK